MKLAVKERIVLTGLYPREGNVIEQMLVRDIMKKVTLSQEEQKKINFRPTQSGFTWNDKESDIEVKFTDAERGFLRTQVERLDKAKKITQDLLSVCLKIKG